MMSNDTLSSSIAPECHTNRLATLFRYLGVYTVSVEGIDFFDYNGIMMPAYLPHVVPEITEEMVREVLWRSDRLMVRWTVGLDSNRESEWWYVLRKGTWDLGAVPDKKKRWMVRQGRKNFQCRPLTSGEIVRVCESVARKAVERYQGNVEVEAREELERRAEGVDRFPDTLQYVGCFQENKLVSYCENVIQDHAVFMSVIRHNPEYLNQYSGYALIDWILNHYLNELGMRYVLDGARSIYHQTGIQDHLVSVFGFTREFTLLRVRYSSLVRIPLALTYPFYCVLSSWSGKHRYGFVDKLCALLLQERIVRSCKSLSVLSNPGGTPLTRDPAVRIIPMSRRHVDAVAGLHQRGINQGFLSVLGDRFLRFLYKATLRHDQTFGRVAEMDGRVVGFICCTETIGGLYRHMIQEYFLELVWVSLPRILCWTNIKKAFETLFYPSYTSGLLPKAEILSVAVDETARGQGLGRKLMVEALAEFRLRKIEQVKVAVGEMLPSNDYYRKLNFVFQGRQRHHGYNLNVYTITTGIATPSIPPYTQPALPQ